MQILLDEARFGKVEREAERRGTSIAAVIRAAIDQMPSDSDQRRAAVAAILSAEPMPVPADPTDLRRERDSAHARWSR